MGLKKENDALIYKTNPFFVLFYKIIPLGAILFGFIFAIIINFNSLIKFSSFSIIGLVMFIAVILFVYYATNTFPVMLKITKEAFYVKRWFRYKKYYWNRVHLVKFDYWYGKNRKLMVKLDNENLFNNSIELRDTVRVFSPMLPLDRLIYPESHSIAELITEMKKYTR